MSEIQFQLRASDSGEYYFRIRSAGNYKILAHSQLYKHEDDARHAIDLIQQGAGKAAVLEPGEKNAPGEEAEAKNMLTQLFEGLFKSSN